VGLERGCLGGDLAGLAGDGLCVVGDLADLVGVLACPLVGVGCGDSGEQVGLAGE
jgi:hypothetical protein